ncbi:chemotaxis protein CheR [Denitratisoma sp. agr-D3]
MITGQKDDREFVFTDADFERVRKLIYDHAGIALAPIKRDMVYSRLVRRLRALGLPSFAQYLTVLEKGDAKEWEIFVNSLTTNLTYFFREAHHFDVLAQHMKESRQRPYRIWCSAASTGEEPYSLAMTACEAFNTLNPPVSIIASDIDTSVLNTARQGVYGRDRTEKLSPNRLQKFFIKDASGKEGLSRVRPELQALITYQRVNLLDARYAGVEGPFDALFCRNVMIYFDKQTQYAILKKFKPLLKADGLLFAGHSESFLHAADLFHSLGKTVYEHTERKRKSGESA